MRRSLFVIIAMLNGTLALGENPSIVARDIQQYETACRPSAGMQHLAQEQTWSKSDRQRTLEDLRAWIAQHNVRNPRQLVDTFHAAPGSDWPRNSFLLGHSRSAQQRQIAGQAIISPQNPRALVYGNGMIFGMVGHSNPNQNPQIAAANNSVEVIQYDATRRGYRFAVLDFNANPPTVTESESCQRCHGNPPRPIWQPLNFWDFLTRNNNGVPFARPNSLYSSLRSRSNRPLDNWRDVLNFTTYTDHLNHLRTAAIFQNSPDYARYRYATLAAVMGCGNIPEFLDPATRTQHETRTGGMERLLETTEARMTRNSENTHEFGLRFDHLDQATRAQPPAADLPRLAALRYLFEGEGRGVPFRNLSSHFPPGEMQYGFGFAASGPDAGLGTAELLCHLLPDAVRADHRLFRLLSARTTGSPQAPASEPECQHLRQLSLGAFAPAPRGGWWRWVPTH